jgi:Mg-chelatase subunit ChlI
MVMLAVILATLPIYAVAGCKKKVQSVDVKSTEIFDEELPIRIETLESEQDRQSDQLHGSYSFSEDDEDYAEEPEEDEQLDDDEEQDEDYDDDEQQYDDEEGEEDSDEDPNYYYESDPNDYSNEEADDSW